jgi:uncharacterized integral membrane protein
MIKFLKVIQASLVVIYILGNIYLMILNWGVYTESMELNYGFGSFSAPLFLVVESVGLILIFLLWLTIYSKDLRYEISKLKRERNKNKVPSENASDNSEGLEMNINQQISQLQKQMEDLTRLLKSSQNRKSDISKEHSL